MDVVRIFDTTLRDGEQSPGFSMNTAEKIRVAHQLAALNVDVHRSGISHFFARGPGSGASGSEGSTHVPHRGAGARPKR